MESIWKKTKIPGREPLPGDLEAEAVVIGAGMAGILTAYELQRRGVNCIVLEADRIGSGQTGNTTAKITSQHALCYDRLIRSFGLELARQYARANEAALGQYERLIGEKKIACEFERCPAYLYSQVDVRKLEKELEAARAVGIEAELTDQTTLPFSVEGALKFPGQAQFHPLEFLRVIAEELTVYEKTRVLRAEGRRLCTDRGTVSARYVVFATHFPFVNMPGYYFSRMHQERSYVVALSEAGQMDGMYYGIDPGGLSFRDADHMLLLGGGGHRTGENREGGKYRLLEASARRYWEDCRVKARWSAQDCMTLDGVPYIGRFSENTENWYVATGFGKWGMTSSMVSAQILADLITGEENRDAEIFSPQRTVTAGAACSFLENGGRSAKELGKRVLSGSEVKVCPHMGCALSWNQDEETYECPCHGSRFDRDGKLLDNPAQEDLS